MKYSIIRKYDFKIHSMISLCIAMIISLIKYINMAKGAYSVGMIGGDDGPTVLLIKSLFIINRFCFIPAFIILILLYKPIKYIIQKFKVG